MCAPERLVFQVQVQTGFELAEDGFTIRALDAKTWQERRRRLNASRALRQINPRAAGLPRAGYLAPAIGILPRRSR